MTRIRVMKWKNFTIFFFLVVDIDVSEKSKSLFNKLNDNLVQIVRKSERKIDKKKSISTVISIIILNGSKSK